MRGRRVAVGRRGAGAERLGRWLMALGLVLALGAGVVRPEVAAARQIEVGERPLDLAAMALAPGDLAEAGLEGYTTSAAGWQPAEEIVAQTAQGLGLDEDEVAEALIEDAGLGASYDYELDFVDPESEDFAATARVRTYLSQHADAAGAAAGFAFREDEDFEGLEDVEDAETFGDESELTQFTGSNDFVAAYAGLDLTVRVGAIYAGVQLYTFGEEGDDPEELDAPRVRDVEALAERLVEKIEAVLDGDEPGSELSLRALRLEGEPAPFLYYDHYDFVDGVYAPYLGEVETAEGTAAGFEEIGATARYTLRQAVSAEDAPRLEDLVYTVQLFVFEDADAAESWVGDAIGFLEGDTRYEDIDTEAAEDDLGDLGDVSAGATYAFDYGQGPVDGVVVYLAVEELGAAMFAESIPGIGTVALAELAEAQVVCLEDAACSDPVAAPVVGEAEADDEADADDEEGTPEADEDDADDADADDVTPDAGDDEDADSGQDDADEDAEDTPAADDEDADETPAADDEDEDETPVADDEVEDETPTADDDDEPVDDEEDEQAGGGEYESPTYGYVWTWDEDEWEVALEDQDPDDEYDSIYLSNGVSIVGVTGDPDYDPDEMDACVSDYVRGLEGGENNSEVEPLDERGAEGSEDELAWETNTYIFTDEDGDESEWTRYVECRYAGDGVTLVIYQDAPVDEYEDEIAAREDVLEGLEVAEE